MAVDMVLLVPVLAGIGVALLRGGSLRYLSDLSFRLGWLALLSLLVQMGLAFYPESRLESDRTLQATLMLASYGALVVVVWANRQIPGMPIVGLGLLLNLAVMASNGGFMPVTREALLAAGIHSAESLPAEGARLARSKEVLLSAEQTRLWLLSDVIVVPFRPTDRACSVGDLIIGLGTFALFQLTMVPGRGRRKREAEANAA